MIRTRACSGITVEVFVEKDEVAPVRVGLKLFQVFEHRPPAFPSRRKISFNRRDNSPATSQRS